MEFWNRFTDHLFVKMLGLSLGITSFAGLVVMVVLTVSLQHDVDSLKAQNTQLQAQVDSKSPYPVALAQSVLTLEGQLKEANKRVAGLSQELTDVRKRQNGFEQELVDSIPGHDWLIKFKRAQEMLSAGHEETARTLTIYAVSDLVGRDNFSCRATPVTDAFLVSYVMPKENIERMLQGSGYAIHEVGANSYGAETLKFRADGYINAC